MAKKVEVVEKTDFELGQIDALNKVISSFQKWAAEIESTTFGQLNVMSSNDDSAFLKLRERLSTIRNMIEQMQDIKESI